MSATEEYLKAGGLRKRADEALSSELQKAQSDSSHPLYLVLEAQKNGNSALASELLIAALNSADEGSPLNLIGLMFVKLPAIQEAIKFAENNDGDALDGLPPDIIKMAGIGVGKAAEKSKAGRAKGKKQRNEVIALWEASEKKLTIPAFAKWCFHKLGGSYTADDKPAGKVPTERTIAKYIREHTKSNTAF